MRNLLIAVVPPFLLLSHGIAFAGGSQVVVPTEQVATPSSSQVTEQAAATPEVTAAAPASVPAIAAGTTIVVALDAAVSSTTANQGDFFPIILAEPILFDGREIVPAGIRGEGQVVHAQHRGWGGRAGELIVAARYLQWGDRRLALRGMHLGAAGRNGAGLALAVNAAVGPVGALISGRSANLQQGQLATARLVDAITIDPAAIESSTQPSPANASSTDTNATSIPAAEGNHAPAAPTGG